MVQVHSGPLVGVIAQLVEHQICILGVWSSSLHSSTVFLSRPVAGVELHDIAEETIPEKRTRAYIAEHNARRRATPGSSCGEES